MGPMGSFLILASPSSSKGSSNLNCLAVVLPCPFPPGLQMTSNIWSTWHTQVSERAQCLAICLWLHAAQGAWGQAAEWLRTAMQAASPPPYPQAAPDARVGKRGHHEGTRQLCHCSCSLCCWQLGLNIHGNKRLVLCALGTGGR